ncbi:hypothetical protein CBS14141_001033 [Malassezia furfur]|nr:hypothetical protein CBS14141_001033 [Malassezia furfur]
MLPSGIASASLDLFNAAPADPGKPSVHAVPSHGVRAAPRRMPDTAVSVHALHAATCRIDVLGTDAFVLARVLQSGTELEVRVLGSEQEPAPSSFTFAAPLLANVGVFQDAQTSEVHLLAVTHAGMLCRLRIPLTTLLRGTRLPSGWASEWAIEGLNASSNALEATSVHAVDAGLVLVACADGSLLQLRQSITSEGFVGAWRESSMRPASFLSGVSRLFQRGVMASPSRAAQRTAPTQTLALASHVREDGTALAFCVCRDRKLRVWNLISESCVRTIDLPLSFSATGTAAEVEERDSDAFERTSAPLVQLFTPSDDDTYALYLLVFVPAPLPHGAFVAAYGIELEESASWSGGVGEMALVWGKSCDARTQAADVELRDMALTRARARLRTRRVALPCVCTRAVRLSCSTPLRSVRRLAKRRPRRRLSRASVAPARRARRALRRECSVRLAGSCARRINAQAEPARYTPVREHKLALLQTATCAWELLRTSAHTWRTEIAGVVRDEADALYDAVDTHVPAPALERLHARVATVGPDTFVHELFALTELLTAPLSHRDAPRVGTLGTTLGAEGAAEVITARVHALRAVIVLHAALLRHAQHHPPLERSLHAAVRAWMHAEALHSLVTIGGVPETTAAVETEAVASLHNLRLDSSADDVRPAMHLLHALAQRGALTCGVRDDVLELALGTLPASGTCAPPAVLRIARHLLDAGFPSAVRAVLAVYTSDAAASYLVALAETQGAQCEVALGRLARIAAVLSSTRADERKRLLAVLPARVAEARPSAQRIVFFTSAAPYWEAAGDLAGALHCYQRALDALHDAPDALDDADAQQLYSHVFRGQLGLARYDAAAATLLAIPAEELREVCLQTLVTALCEAGALAELLRLHLGELQPRVERVLSFKARNAAPLSTPNYFQILYAYHIARGDYKSAAASMYQQARRLRDAALVASATDVHQARALLVREAQCDLAAINALVLLPAPHAWFAHAMHDADEGAGDESLSAHAAAGRALPGGITSYLPRERLGAHAHPLKIVQLADVRREYHHLLARLELMRLYPELANPSASLRADDAVNLFLAADDVDAAFATALQLHVDLRNAFDALAHKCVALQRADEARRKRLDLDADTPDAALAQLTADDEEGADVHAAFLRNSSRAVGWSGPAHERAWRYVRLQLDLADAAASGAQAAQYRTALADRLVALDAWDVAPAWLRDWFTQHGPDLLLRVFLRHGARALALTYATHVVDRTITAARTSSAQPVSCLPYSLFDALLTTDPDASGAQPLRDALARRLHALGARAGEVGAPS